jgi:hypothetical protein
LALSLCLHSNTVSQGFDELVKLDPCSRGFFVANTITIKADDLERLLAFWLHTTWKGGIRQLCVSYPLSAFSAMDSDKDFAAGHICSFPLCYHDCFTHTPRELSECNKLQTFANRICGQNVKEQASPFRLRIQARDLIRRQDLDFWLPGSKSDCAGDADGFPLDHGKSLVNRYREPGCNESGERLIGVLSSEIDKCGPQWAGRHRDNTTPHLGFLADVLDGFGVFYHYRLVRVRHNCAENQSENCK